MRIIEEGPELGLQRTGGRQSANPAMVPGRRARALGLMNSLRAFCLLAALLVVPIQAVAAGLGWYYDSFSWAALHGYFGAGTPAKKRLHGEHLQALIERERRAPYYYISIGPAEARLWESFINDGLQYDRLSRSGARFADRVIAIVMDPNAKISGLDVRSHTDPDYIHSGAFLHMLTRAEPRAKEFLELFEYGRSFGQSGSRLDCTFEGVAWSCIEAYVVLSPEECSVFGRELLAMLNSPAFLESEFEERTYVTPLAKALVAAGKRKRGMYLRSTD